MTRPVLLIAGGSRGIGAATARLAGERGYDVAVNYVSNAKAAASVGDAVTKAGGKSVTLRGDMSKEDDIVARFRCGDAHAWANHAFRSQRRHRRQEFAARRRQRRHHPRCARCQSIRRSSLRARSGAPHVDGPWRQGRIDRAVVVDRRADRRRDRIRVLRRRQRRGRCADQWAWRAKWRRKASGSMPCGRVPPIPRSTSPDGWRGLRRCCRWDGPASQTKSPRRSCFCLSDAASYISGAVLNVSGAR